MESRSGPLRGTAGRVFWIVLLLIRRGGDPSGAAAIIVNGGVFKKISYHTEQFNLIWKCRI